MLAKRLRGRIARLPSQHVERLDGSGRLAYERLVRKIKMRDIVIKVLLGFFDLLRGYWVVLLVDGVEAEHLSDVLQELERAQILVLVVLALNANEVDERSLLLGLAEQGVAEELRLHQNRCEGRMHAQVLEHLLHLVAVSLGCRLSLRDPDRRGLLNALDLAVVPALVHLVVVCHDLVVVDRSRSRASGLSLAWSRVRRRQGRLSEMSVL